MVIFCLIFQRFSFYCFVSFSDQVLSDTDNNDLTVIYSKKRKKIRSPMSPISPSVPSINTSNDFDIIPNTMKSYFHVTGMSCSSCVGKIEREVKKKKGEEKTINKIS